MDGYRGIFTPICTPFRAGDQEVDENALSQLIEFQIASGVSGIITCAGTGQFSALRLDERKRVTEVAVAEVQRRVPVIAHTGACGTAETVELSQHAKLDSPLEQLAGAAVRYRIAPGRAKGHGPTRPQRDGR